MTATIDDPRLPARFWAKVSPEPNSGCWLWIGAPDKDGYGMFQHEGGVRRAHRFAYRNLSAEIPRALVIDHLCRQRCCVNPAHMEPVTHAVNILRGEGRAAINASRTVCPRGHSYDEQNTYLDPNGGRICRTCKRDSSRNDRLDPMKADVKRRQGRESDRRRYAARLVARRASPELTERQRRYRRTSYARKKALVTSHG